jgi:hypothetical protein
MTIPHQQVIHPDGIGTFVQWETCPPGPQRQTLAPSPHRSGVTGCGK